MNVFPEKLASLRRERGLSQRAVASNLHISQALLSHYENGAREPGLEFICRVCDYYGVTADYLLGRTENPGVRKTDPELKALAEDLRLLAERTEKMLSDESGREEKSHA